MIGRRAFLGAGLGLLAGCAGTGRRAANEGAFDRIRSSLGPGARLGVAALDTGNGRRISFDAEGQYAMASTFKVALAAAVLAKVDAGELSLTEPVRFSEADLLGHAPVVRANLGRRSLPLLELCSAIVEVSDNSAANLLLARIGGPAGLTRFMRDCGDPVSRLDRIEPELNLNLPGDPRDTTAPSAMLGLMEVLLVGERLSRPSRTRLHGWMVNASTGLDRLRAGFPSSWRAGDKTGTGMNGAHNDIAIAWPSGRRPILVTSYQSGGDAGPSTREAAHVAVARLVAGAFA